MNGQDCEQGSPPRVRGEVLGIIQRLQCIGITPACAGRRGVSAMHFGTSEDHPRVCGEKPAHCLRR